MRMLGYEGVRWYYWIVSARHEPEDPYHLVESRRDPLGLAPDLDITRASTGDDGIAHRPSFSSNELWIYTDPGRIAIIVYFFAISVVSSWEVRF